jgi:hypothetical protein
MENPIEWRDLNKNLRNDRVTKLYIGKCTDIKLFNNRRLDNSYFKIKNYFNSRPDDEVAKIFDYLYELEGKVNCTLSEIYKLAEKYRKDKLFEEQVGKSKEMVKNGQIKKYEDITISDIMSL